tara:strand:+ start:139 stop:327 length:189 start_codon:yes stop_codon:yes gene_type:complete
MVKEYGCRSCHTLTTGKVCPACHSTDVSPDWAGLAIIFDVENSQVAQSMGIKAPGRYAIKVT